MLSLNPEQSCVPVGSGAPAVCPIDPAIDRRLTRCRVPIEARNAGPLEPHRVARGSETVLANGRL